MEKSEYKKDNRPIEEQRREHLRKLRDENNKLAEAAEEAMDYFAELQWLRTAVLKAIRQMDRLGMKDAVSILGEYTKQGESDE